MINRFVGVGRLTKDVELRYSSSGVAIGSFTIAINRTFTNQSGEREADFINCVTFKKTAENVANFCKKGSLVGVDGRLQSRSFEGQNGRVYITEVVADSVQFLETKREGTGAQQQPVDQQTQQAPNNQQKTESFNKQQDPFANIGQPIDISDDDLPF